VHARKTFLGKPKTIHVPRLSKPFIPAEILERREFHFTPELRDIVAQFPVVKVGGRTRIQRRPMLDAANTAMLKGEVPPGSAMRGWVPFRLLEFQLDGSDGELSVDGTDNNFFLPDDLILVASWEAQKQRWLLSSMSREPPQWLSGTVFSK